MNPVLTPKIIYSRNAAFGLGWSVATQVAGTGVKLASTLVLTRLLAPEAYALLGTAMVVLTTLEWLSDFGVTPTLVRHTRGGERGWLLVGWQANFRRGLVLTAIAAVCAAPLAAFYHQPELFGVLLALAARPLIMSLRSPGVPLLRRNLEYRALFVDELTQALTGTLTAILVAVTIPGAGAWALVAGTLVGALAGVVVSYLLAPLAPRHHHDLEASREIRKFGGLVVMNTLVMAVWLNLDRLIGPRFLPLDAVGCYIVAWNLAMAAEAVVTRKIDVYFALMSRLPVGDRADWHQGMVPKVMRLVGPALAVGVAIAPLVVAVLYDSRYQSAGILFAVLLARLVVRTIGQLDFQLLLASGNIRPATVSYLAGAVTQGVLIVPLVLSFGVNGLAVSALISASVVTLVQVVLAPELRSGALRRMGVAALWSVIGLATAALTSRMVG